MGEASRRSGKVARSAASSANLPPHATPIATNSALLWAINSAAKPTCDKIAMP